MTASSLMVPTVCDAGTWMASSSGNVWARRPARIFAFIVGREAANGSLRTIATSFDDSTRVLSARKARTACAVPSRALAHQQIRNVDVTKVLYRLPAHFANFLHGFFWHFADSCRHEYDHDHGQLVQEDQCPGLFDYDAEQDVCSSLTSGGLVYRRARGFS